ncbi:MAG: hypothetical protein NTZ03_00020 [Actinobacteria bacterium]|nr:hypothetical protein [Actinomycetota bacterium]
MPARSTITAPEFTVTLPEWVMVRGTCEVEVTPQHLVLRYGGRQLTLPGPTTLAGYCFAPLAQGRALSTTELPPHARDVLTMLASRGILVDPSRPGALDASDGASGINTIGCLNDEIFRTGAEIPSNSTTNWELFLAGRFYPEWVRVTFLEQYLFTRSVGWHISPVLDHELSPLSRAAWHQFLADELPHYRIWRPAFSSFGWSFAEVQRQIPREPTSWLIESYRGAAAHSELSYLGIILKTEAAPVERHYNETAYFRTLITEYGVPESVIRPLWWHVIENELAGHGAMPATLLSELGPVSSNQLAEAFGYIRLHALAIRDFNDEMVASFGMSRGELPDLT